MGDTFDWWWMGGDYYDRKQQRALDDLAASHAQSDARMRRSLAEQRQANTSLATRVEQLERALAAVIALEDVREELTQHADAALVRRYARDVVAQLAAFGGVPSPTTLTVPLDVAGYWLHPAAQALDAELHGDGEAARALFDQARSRDPHATDVFSAALAGIRGPGTLPPGVGERLWGDTEIVSVDERVLWGAVATGRLGQDARQALIASLRTRAGFAEDPEAAGRFMTDVLKVPAAGGSDPVAAGRALASIAELVGAPRTLAAPRLEDTTTVTVTSTSTATDPATSDPVTSAPSTTQPTTTTSIPADSLAELLATTVVRGAPDEQATIRRMQDIRAVLFQAGIGAPQPSRDGDRDAGTVTELLAEDLTGTTDTPEARARRRLALEVVATELAPLSQAWHRQVTTAEPISSATVRVEGSDVTIGPDGPARGWSTRLDANATPPRSWAKPAAIGMGVATVLVLVLAVVTGNVGLWVVAVLAGAGALGIGVWARSERRVHDASRDRTRRNAERRLETAQRELVAARAELASVQDGADEHLATIDTALGRRAPMMDPSGPPTIS